MILHIHASVDWLAGNSIIGEYSYSWGIELELLLLKVWSIELKPCLTWRLIQNPTDPGLKPGRVEKNKERKNPVWPGWSGGLTRQEPTKNLVAIHWLFLLKKHFFYLKKKGIDPDYPVTQSKLEIRILDRAGSKNDGVKHSIFVSMK